MYWTRQGGVGVTVQRANLDGSAVENLVSGQPVGEGIALDVAGGVMYWAELSHLDRGEVVVPGRIRRANLAGRGVDDVVTGVSPMGVAFLPPLRLAGCLLLDLKRFVDSCLFCPKPVKESLLHKIVGAIRQVDKGHSRPAANALLDFEREITRLIAQRQLPAEEGRQFIALSREIIGEL